MPRSAALFLVVAGLILIVAGLLAYTGGLNWFGRLPGDIRIERPGTRVYVPLVSMIVVSVVLTIVVNLVRRFF